MLRVNFLPCQKLLVAYAVRFDQRALIQEVLARNLMEMKQMCWEEVDTSYVLLDALPILDLFRLLFAIKQTIFDDLSIFALLRRFNRLLTNDMSSGG